jgi:hypothetical protein
MAMSLISVRTNKSFLRFGFPKVWLKKIQLEINEEN